MEPEASRRDAGLYLVSQTLEIGTASAARVRSSLASLVVLSLRAFIVVATSYNGLGVCLITSFPRRSFPHRAISKQAGNRSCGLRGKGRTKH